MSYGHWNEAKRVCVIGAGTMGSGIAAHLANIGFEVSLLDLSRDSVENAFAKAKSLKPPHFYIPETANKIRLGSIENDLHWVAEADWICEAIVEKLDVKRALFEQIEAILPESAMISTNTSGLQIGLLAEGRSESFKKRFLGTHFFNPPRYLKLLELIPTEETDPEAVRAFTSFLENSCARRVVVAKDTPGFIANRFGMWAMIHAIHSAEKLGLAVEDVDVICGPFLGRPRSGAFRLNDLVGLDIMQDIANNLIARCSDDPHVDNLNTPRSMGALIARGHIGSKTGMGYYRREGKELLALDLGTLAYRQQREVRIPSVERHGKAPLGARIAATLEAGDEAGEFLRTHLVPVLNYADYLKEEISHSVQDFDRVMKWGFGWEVGPFEMIDAIGSSRIAATGAPFYQESSQRKFDGKYEPLKLEPEYAAIHDFKILETRDGFNVRDMGDGVVAFSLTTKMGSINPTLIKSLDAALDDPRYDRIVLTGESKSYSVGFDLNFFQERINFSDWESIDQALAELQNLTLKLGTKRTVAAVYGFALGAGAELMMGCSQVCAHPDAQIGLPEVKVGLLPGGAGTTILAVRSQLGGAKKMCEVSMALSTGFVSSCADEARKFDLLRPTDVTAYHPDRLLYDAKKLAMNVEPSAPVTWAKIVGPLGGMIDREQDELRKKGEFSAHDEMIGDQIKHVFTKPITLEGALAEERIGFIHLCKNGLTAARINHMLDTGKPLKN